jgi:integrase
MRLDECAGGDVMVDINELLRDMQGRIDLTIGGVTLPNGVQLQNVYIETADDERQFRELLAASSAPVATPKPRMEAKAQPIADDFLAARAAVHLDDLKRAGRDAKTVMESRHTLYLLEGIVGDKPVAELSANDCRAFFDAVVNWPKHATKRPDFAGLSVREVLKKAAALNEPKPAAATLNKHHQRLSAFLNWLKTNKVIAENPLLDLVRQDKDEAQEETGRAFTQAELNAIFEPAAYASWAAAAPHRWWVPLLALYSGARVTELSQLYVADIEAAADGVLGFHINRRYPGQKLKNKASRRFVPLAKPVLDAGFMAFVADVKAAGHERLFPHLPNFDGNGFGRQMSKQFGAYINERGVTEAGMGMHAFRHTLATRLARAKISLDTIGKITGHKGTGGTLGKFYIDEPTLDERVAALAQFHAGVALPTYEQGAFVAALNPATIAGQRKKPERRAVKTMLALRQSK